MAEPRTKVSSAAREFVKTSPTNRKKNKNTVNNLENADFLFFMKNEKNSARSATAIVPPATLILANIPVTLIGASEASRTINPWVIRLYKTPEDVTNPARITVETRIIISLKPVIFL